MTKILTKDKYIRNKSVVYNNKFGKNEVIL